MGGLVRQRTLSPGAMAAARLDWLGHLTVSPGQQQTLALRAFRRTDDDGHPARACRRGEDTRPDSPAASAPGAPPL